MAARGRLRCTQVTGMARVPSSPRQGGAGCVVYGFPTPWLLAVLVIGAVAVRAAWVR
jgi:hypothetical protein